MKSWNMRLGRRRVVVTAAVVVAGAIGVAFATGAIRSNADDAWVACVKNQNGQVRIVDEASHCLASEHSIALAKPTTPPGPQQVTVDCNAGESIQQAIDQSDRSQPLTVTINGTCPESVHITRDWVTLQGSGSGAGIHAPTDGAAIWIDGARYIRLAQLTLTGGGNQSPLLNASNGSSVSTHAVDITGGQYGLGAWSNASVAVDGGMVSNSQVFGVNAGAGAHIALFGGAVVRGAGFHGVIASNSGSIEVHDATVESSAGTGVFAFQGGSVSVWNGAVVRNNDKGGVGANAASAGVSGGLVTGNNESGVFGFNGGQVTVQGGAVVEGNHGFGIYLATGSTLALGDSTTAVRENDGSGVLLKDTSVVTGGTGGAVIADNGGWGISCAPAPAVAMISGPANFAFSGNAAGDTNCPIG
jgi:hypothetical protein